MTIDWITVSAQILNFLVLVWLLKHFLYQPVIRAMDEREQRVTQRLSEARKREQDAAAQGEQFRQQQAELSQNREQTLKEVQQEAIGIKQNLINEARTEVDKIRQAWQQQAELERQTFLETLRHKTTNTVVDIARKALGELANVELETQLLTTFIANLNELPEADRKRISAAGEPVEIVSSFPLNETQRDQLRAAITAQFSTHSEPKFKVSPELGFGLQLNAAEQRIGWNLSNYLDDLGQDFSTLLTDTKGS